jgi:co-chaperonin GroES (HSP10)
MTPLADNILVESVDIAPASGSLLLTTAKEQRTRVVAVGKDVKLVKPGDFVVINQIVDTGAGLFAKEKDVIAIIKGDV